jgi:magnesium-transporting ATPase (P-type)
MNIFISTVNFFLKKLKIYDVAQKKSKFRIIYVNNEKPIDYYENSPCDLPSKYVSNKIKTSKYNLISFLPTSLFEQFRRIANLYFLTTITIQFAIPSPATSPYGAVLPLLVVILFTSLKQGYEDILRHQTDSEINNSPVHILRNGQFQLFKWQDIRCGDIVQVKCETQLPCDLVVLLSDTSDGICYKTTANLDGETNLKRRSVPAKFTTLKTMTDLAQLRCVIKYDKPNLCLDTFTGKLILHGQGNNSKIY